MGVNRRVVGATGGLLSLVLVSACVEPDVRPATTLIGATKEEVRSAWGAPILEFEHPRTGQRYILYGFPESYTYYQFFILPRHGRRVYCYLLEMTEDDVVKTFDIPNVFSSVSGKDDCVVSFFGDDPEMAIYLAQEHRMTSALTYRAFEGDPEAARLVAAKSHDKVPALIAFAGGADWDVKWGSPEPTEGDVQSGINALKHLCKAAQQDNGEPQFVVATLLAEDGWVDIDPIRKQLRVGADFFPSDSVAYYWYRQADRNGVEGAKEKISELTVKMDPRDIERASAWEFDPLIEYELDPKYTRIFGAPVFTECPLPITGDKNKKALIRERTVARAMAGDPNAARRMGDFDQLRTMAEAGDRQAAVFLAVDAGDFSFTEAIFDAGDSDIAYSVYTRMSRGKGVSAQGWRWLCRAADAGIADAQREVGFWLRTDRWARARSSARAELRQAGFEPDDVRAYMWYTLASSEPNSPQVPERVLRNLTPAERARARKMAQEWQPGACPRAIRPPSLSD